VERIDFAGYRFLDLVFGQGFEKLGFGVHGWNVSATDFKTFIWKWNCVRWLIPEPIW